MRFQYLIIASLFLLIRLFYYKSFSNEYLFRVEIKFSIKTVKNSEIIAFYDQSQIGIFIS